MSKETIITETIARFYSLIKEYHPGKPDTRYKSWEWCHKAFVKKKDEYYKTDNKQTREEIIDYLSLHLGFYLASWGMYRGSSYLLQRDYKTHTSVVEAILNLGPDSILWDYNPNEGNLCDAYKALFIDPDAIYWKIKQSYISYKASKGEDDEPSDTLATKILMGSLGCIPAFDRYLKEGIKVFQKDNGGVRKCSISKYKLTQSLETKGKNKATESFLALAQFYINHENSFRLDPKPSDICYPPMKLIDMFFWEIGYEMDLAKSISKAQSDKDKIISQAQKIGIIDRGLQKGEAEKQLSNYKIDLSAI